MAENVRTNIRGISKETIQTIDERAEKLNISRNQMILIILDDYAEAFRQQDASELLQNSFEKVINVLNVLTKVNNENNSSLIESLNAYSEATTDSISRIEDVTLRLEQMIPKELKNQR